MIDSGTAVQLCGWVGRLLTQTARPFFAWLRKAEKTLFLVCSNKSAQKSFASKQETPLLDPSRKSARK
jgi:aspartyl-tRNA synthetase